MAEPSLRRWQRAESLLAAGRASSARDEYQALLEDPDWVLPARLRLGQLALEAGEVGTAVDHALAAHAVREPDAVLLEALCALLLQVGELRAALDCVEDPAIAATHDAQVLAALGRLMSAQGLPDLALPLLRRARARGLDTPELRYLCGNEAAYAGDADAAEASLESCLQLAPAYGPAHRALAKLRRATPERNHVARLRALVARTPEAHPEAPLLYFALFKELDDLGDTEAAWPALATGLRLRRAQVRHDVASEATIFEWLERQPTTPAPAEPAPGPVPVFILGQPRSGSTLLERLLGSHPDVTDAGELRDFTTQLRMATGQMGGPQLDPALARAALDVDVAALGRAYLAHTQWQALGRPFYTDKLPANFVHVGLIARALPQAKILHVVREPMDLGFSQLKELFADAYPYSYDQAELAIHLRRYRALMAHWHALFPGRVLDVSYEALVAEPEAQARRVLDFCGLAWDPAVLAPEARGGSVATASAAQVREGIHARYVGQWKRYERWLEPLRRGLAAD